MSNRTATLLLVVVVMLAVGWLVSWLESRFSSVVALCALVMIFFFLVIVVVYQMVRGQARETMELLVDFGQKDAMTDRYRSQTTLEATRGVTVDSRIALLDAQEERAARRQQMRLANQQQMLIGPVDPYQASPDQQPGHYGAGYPARIVGQAEENYKEYD